MIGGPGLHGGTAYPEGVHVDVEFSYESLGQALPVFPHLIGPVDDFVVHIGEVSHISDFVASFGQVPKDHVKKYDRPGVTDMTHVINRDPADVHPHFSGTDGFKLFLLAGERVVNSKTHQFLPT